MTARRSNIPRRLQIAVRERDGDICRYCGRPVFWDVQSTRIAGRIPHNAGSFDHQDPWGGDHVDNLVVACWNCNMAKGERTAEEWQASLMYRIRVRTGEPLLQRSQVAAALMAIAEQDDSLDARIAEQLAVDGPDAYLSQRQRDDLARWRLQALADSAPAAPGDIEMLSY